MPPTNGGGARKRGLRFVNWAWLSVLAGLALSMIGLDAIDIGERLSPQPGDPSGPIEQKQTLFLMIGLVASAIIALPYYRLYAILAWPLYAMGVALLVFLLIPFVPESIVKPRNGARGWIDLGFVDLQPAEFAKIAYVLAIAAFLRARRANRRFLGLIAPAIITLIPAALITKQPDLGSAALFAPAFFAMLIAGGARIRHLALIIAIAGLGAPAIYPLLEAHQKQRIIGFVGQLKGDRSTASDINFQSFTAQALVGAGGATGQPEAKTRAMVHFNRLPERHNDMIYAVIVCRHGQRGGLVVLGLYGVWLLGALMTAATSHDPFGRLIVLGLAGFVAAQVFVNVGMNIGVLPIIGITLPFISYGGSSLLTVWLMTGLILNVAMHPLPESQRRLMEYAEGNDD